nr:biotin/lipoyl-binding protein [Woeseiaceae bacterium]
MASLIKRHAGAFQLVFVVAVVGSAVMLSASLKPDERDIRPRSVSEQVEVTVVQPVQTAFSPLVELNGVVEARTITSIIPQVEGRVIEVAPGFRPGAVVAKGDVLFRIDPADYELAVERTLADIEVARSELAQLEAEAAAEREIWQSTSPDRPIPDLRARVPQIAAAEARLHSGQAARARKSGIGLSGDVDCQISRSAAASASSCASS